MVKFLLPLLCMVCTCISGMGQKYVYANTNNLLIRDRPDQIYNVYAIAHKGCAMKLQPIIKGYENKKSLIAGYYYIRVKSKQTKNGHTSMDGWVSKKYVVKSPTLVSYSKNDTSDNTYPDLVDLIPYFGPEEDDPNNYNCYQYPWPKYKGGEKSFPSTQKPGHVYHRGPRGGCYYVSPLGRKVYVDGKFCKPKKAVVPKGGKK